tara:strand:+ start:5696 stop:5929 length:234 start_codon:yes stop_codon:yes gene_type:complete
MIHPGLGDLKQFNDRQLDEKIYKLNGMYFMTENDDVRQQMILLIDTYKMELEERRVAASKKRTENGKDDLDSLINIS